MTVVGAHFERTIVTRRFRNGLRVRHNSLRTDRSSNYYTGVETKIVGPLDNRTEKSGKISVL